MRIIKPSAKLMKHDCTPYQFIEKVARTCYKSEDKIKEGSDEKFVGNLVKRQHTAMMEHETLYLIVSKAFMEDFVSDLHEENYPIKFFNITSKPHLHVISGSFRSFIDLFTYVKFVPTVSYLEWLLSKEFPLIFAEPELPIMKREIWNVTLYNRNVFIEALSNEKDILFKHLTHTFRFTCDRGVSHEFVRHRVASFAQESTRYCNYGHENEICVIEPCFYEEGSPNYMIWKASCEFAETSYISLINSKSTPQEARSVLPNSLKTELIITATEEEWQHIVNLRYLGTTGAPHPQIKEVMSLAIPDLVIESKGRINLDAGVK